jgi:hypothetical protein
MMKAGIHQRRGKMYSMTNIYVLLKNLEAFINSVPIDPNLPNCKDWEETRAEMGKALKDTCKILVKQEFLAQFRPCGKVPLKQVFPGPLRLCGKVPLKQVFPDPLQEVALEQPLRMCGKVLIRTVQEQFEPVRKKS